MNTVALFLIRCGVLVAFSFDVLAARAQSNAPPAVVAGSFSVIGLTAHGTALAGLTPPDMWPDYGQGNVGAWSNLRAVAAGDSHTVGLRSNGTVVATGYNYFGQCNVSNWTGIVVVAAAYNQTFGVRGDGTALAIGQTNGGLNVTSWSNIVTIAAGGEFTLGLRSDGTVVATGTNNYGQCNVAAWSNIVAIAAGVRHAVGLRSDGTVVAVGSDFYGETNVSAFSNIIAIAAGSAHTLGLRMDGTVIAVGANYNLQCNVGAWSNIVGIAGGFGQSVGLKSDGTVVAAGRADYGQYAVWQWYLGNQLVQPIVTREAVSETALIGGTAVFDVRAAGPGTLRYLWLKNNLPLANGGRIQGATSMTLTITNVAVSDAAFYSVAVSNGFGAVTSALARLDTATMPPHRRPAIAAGNAHTIGLRADGQLLALGDNSYGTGQTNVSGWNNILAVAAGYAHTLGLRPDGSVLGSGWTNNGQIDVGSWRNVVGLAASIISSVGLKANGTVVVATTDASRADVGHWPGVRAIGAGEFHTLGIRSNGTVIAAGNCSSGWTDLGPCQVGAWSNIVQVAAGWYHVIGLRNDGTVIAAGSNYFGAGLVSNWNNIVAIAAGPFHSVGLRADGTVVATGNNAQGACDVSSWSNVVAISANEDRTVALRADDTVLSTSKSSTDLATWYLGTNQVPPIITESPTNQTVFVPRAAVLRGTAAGPGTIAYRWLKNGTNVAGSARISGTTGRVVTISNAQLDDSGGYSFAASNAYGVTTSAVARLDVELAPAISIGSGGAGPLTFDTLPPFGNWFTYGFPSGLQISTPAQLDASVQTLDTGIVTNNLTATATLPPATGGLARWNSAGRFLQTRPAGVSYTVLMGTFQNDTGQSLDSVHVAFELASYQFPFEGEVPGYRVYFSTSGVANAWTVVPELSGATSGPVAATLNAPLPSGARLYLLWADNNTDGSTDPAHTIDNLTIGKGPRLFVRSAGPNVFDITWSAAVTGYVLHASSEVDGLFQPVAEIETTDAQWHHVQVTNLGTRFFQLRRP